VKKYVVKTTVTHILTKGDVLDDCSLQEVEGIMNDAGCGNNYVRDLIDALEMQLNYYEECNNTEDNRNPNCFCVADAHSVEVLREATEEDFKMYGKG